MSLHDYKELKLKYHNNKWTSQQTSDLQAYSLPEMLHWVNPQLLVPPLMELGEPQEQPEIIFFRMIKWLHEERPSFAHPDNQAMYQKLANLLDLYNKNKSLEEYQDRSQNQVLYTPMYTI